MTKKEITDRKLYLDSLKSDLALNDNAAVVAEMTQRAKQIEGLLKALTSANINCDTTPGIQIFTRIDKNLVVRKYLNDLFFFDAIKLKSNDTDRFIVAEANLGKFAKGVNLLSKDDETYKLMKLEFSKVLDQINSCTTYYQVDNIKVMDEYDKPISRIYIKLLPSDSYLDYLKKIKFISHGKFFSSKKKEKREDSIAILSFYVN